MTIEEALKSNPVFVYIPDTMIEVACINRGVEITDDYSASRLQDLELVSADLYQAIASTPDISEGDLSIKYDKTILLRRAANIYLKYDDDKLSETGFRIIEVPVTKL